jgi:GH25 family lysozyme M1 (1,4-beta-N-acetylmuramidase)
LAVAVSLTASPALAAVVTRSGAGPERGIDISAFQDANGPINWRELARHGIKFVVIKASESNYYANPHYSSDAKAASRAGLAVLAYTFGNPDRAGGAATASFAVRAAHYRRGALPLAVDLENDPYSVNDCYWFSQRRMIAWIAGFTTRARALTGKWPILYTTADWWRECTGSTARFRHDPLWLADYNRERPVAPSPWARWSFWQYSEDGYLPGIGWTDLDYFQSTSRLPSLHPKPKPKKPKPKPKPKHKPKPKPKHKPKPKRKPRHKAKPKPRHKAKPKPKPKPRHKPKPKPKPRHKPKPKRKPRHKPKRKKRSKAIRKGKP